MSQAYRYERKFLVENRDPAQVLALVKRHPSMFYQPYPPRYVNNLYLDTKGMDNYLDNVSGVADRRKVRVRWYGDLLGHAPSPQLEFKIKRGLVGAKDSYPFPSLILDDRFTQRGFHVLARASNLPDFIRYTLRPLDVVLCNRYYRWYFASRDQRFRVTVDAEMAFFPVRRTHNRFRRPFVDHQHLIVELKYGQDLDPQAQRVASFFPFTVTKNSKYVNGIEWVYP
jgi:hypothetical protein